MQINAFMKDTPQLKKPYTFNQRVENLFKSYFANHENAKIECNETEINIYLKDEKNSLGYLYQQRLKNFYF